MLPEIRPLHVAKYLPPPYAGVEAHVDTLVRALQPEVEGTVVAGAIPGMTAEPSPSRPYRALTAKAYGKFASVILSPGVLNLVNRELRDRRCNLLHVHAPNPWGDLAALSSPATVPVVMTWHSDIVRQRKLLKIYRTIQRRALERADRIVVYTPKHYESSEQLHQFDLSKKISLVPIGIDFDRLDPRLAREETALALGNFSRGRSVILTVGRHVYYKGYEYLLSAMSKLRSDAVLVMVGTGLLTDALKRQADELGIRSRVLFLGEADNASLASAFHHCDVFCLPSIEPSEAFGIASAEAMACGKPTVVCELNNGVNYLNQAGRTGLSVPPRDAAALADALDILLRDDGQRLRMGAAANAWVRSQFSIAAMKDGTTRLYESLI
jgi:glycosyltransferase involved in cell wall biosynthesis